MSNNWVTIAKKAKCKVESSKQEEQTSSRKEGQPSQFFQPSAYYPKEVYICFVGRHPGVYLTWAECAAQVNNFPNAVYQKYTVEVARRILSQPGYQYLFQELEKKLKPEVSNFYNPGIPENIYEPLNQSWQFHLVDNRKAYRKSMTTLAETIKTVLSEKTEKLDHLEKICFDLLKNMTWEQDYSYDQIQLFLQISEVLKHKCESPHFVLIRRRCLWDKAEYMLPREVFIQIKDLVEDHQVFIKKALKRKREALFFTDFHIPKMGCLINHDDWFLEDFEWGLTQTLFFQNFAAEVFKDFPSMIKTMIRIFTFNTFITVYFHFEIISSIGWRFQGKFYQPYQIWYLKGDSDIHQGVQNLGVKQAQVSENFLEAMDLEGYWSDSFISLCKTAEEWLKTDLNQLYLFTDGRRIFITLKEHFLHVKDVPETTLWQQAREEAILLLQKIANKDHSLVLPEELFLKTEDWLDQLKMEDSQPDDEDFSIDSTGEINLQNAMDG